MVVMMIGADESDDSWGGIDDDDGDVDIYIMMKCLFVCV